MCSILIVSNNQNSSLKKILQAAKYQVSFAFCGSMLESIKHDILILDLQHVECLEWLKDSITNLPSQSMLLVIAEPAQLKMIPVITLIKTLAWDYHTAPVDHDRLLVTLGRMRGILQFRNIPVQRPVDHGSATSIEKILPAGERSIAMQNLHEKILKVAPTDISVLITGPSGAGKELVARKLHKYSLRASGPLVVVNCGAIAQGLAYSELFGHEKGSFTGAVQKRQGKLALADGGTLFLDEVGDLPLEQQTFLLRFLQEGQFDVVGGGVCQANVRVICATHIDLPGAIAAGKFRLDLFYRLNGVNLEVPSLKQRLEDLPDLAQSLLREAATAMNLDVKPLSRNALIAMRDHDWPGNVRELIHRLRRALILAEGNEIDANDLELNPLPSLTETITSLSLQYQKDKTEHDAIKQALLHVGGKIPLAAKQLNVSRATFYRLLDKYKVTV